MQRNLIRSFYKLGCFCLLFLLFTQTYAATASERAVQKAYYNWCSAIGSAKGDAEVVVKYYAPNAILHPTLSAKMLVNSNNGLNDYFHQLTLRDNIKCTPEQLVTDVYDNIAINSGFYQFSYTDADHKNKAIQARFTFVYKKIGNEWLIINHHSSKTV